MEKDNAIHRKRTLFNVSAVVANNEKIGVDVIHEHLDMTRMNMTFISEHLDMAISEYLDIISDHLDKRIIK